MFVTEAWPDFDRISLWECLERYATRDRRFGGAKDAVADAPGSPDR